MEELVHRYAPRSPLARVLLALVGVVVALPLALTGLYWLARGYGLLPWGVLAVPGLLGLLVVYHFARGVADQAAAAPSAADPTRGRDGDDADDPIRVLQERYARGEIDEETFETRMERLLESDRRVGGTSDRRSEGRREPGETALE